MPFRGCAPHRNNKYSNDFSTLSGAISIAGPGCAFARAGNAVASAGNVGLFGQQEITQLTQLIRTMQEVNSSMQEVNSSMQAVGNSMAKLGDEIVFGNELTQQTFQGINTGLQGLNTTTQQGFWGACFS
ncbi:MAG: hypothetical protein WBX81_08770 [Nitrososphaeraceae archaeon]